MSPDSGSARIVRLASGRPGPCFFLIPGTGGKIDGFVNLAPFLNVPIPVFAIEARGLDEASLPDANVEEMAAHYLVLIRTVQAEGPYFLLGHSFGGLVALEMAQRLLEAGEKMACLIFLDTPTPEKYWPLFFYLRSRVTKVRRHITRIMTSPLMENLKSYRRSLSLRGANLNEMPTNVTIGGNVARVLFAHSIARENYRPKFYCDKVTFFRPLESPGGYEKLWLNRVKDMDVFSAAGDHLSMVELPHAPLLAADLSACLNKILNSDRIGVARPLSDMSLSE
jgi:thioesterase domain-containing protein